MRTVVQKLKFCLAACLTTLGAAVIITSSAAAVVPSVVHAAATKIQCFSDTDPLKTVKCEPCPNGAQVPNNKTDCPNDDCQNLSNCGVIKDYVDPGINLLAALAGVSAVISIVIAGIQYSSSAGEPAKASAAKMRIRNTIIALVAFALFYVGLNFLIPGGLTSL